MGINIENVNDVTALVIVIGFLVSLCIHMLRRPDWPIWISIPLSTVVSIVGLVVTILLIDRVFGEDQTKATEVSQVAGLERSVASEDPDAGVPVLLENQIRRAQPPVASVAPEARAPAPQMETRDRSVNFGKTNDHCAGPRDVRWPVRAEEGWEIDVNSIKVTPTVISSKSSYSGVTDATKDGFDIKGRIVNRGNCVKAFGQVVARDARGTLRVSGTYRETRQAVQERSSD